MDDGQDRQTGASASPPNFGFSVTRVLQDGDNTFVKAVHEPDGARPWVTMSLIGGGKNGLMAVKRQVSVQSVSENGMVASMAGYAVPNGPAEITESSRKQVRRFIGMLAKGQISEAVRAHVDPLQFKLHLLSGSEGQDALEDFLERRRPRDGVRFHGLDDFVSEGNFVAMFSCFDIAGQHYRACDLFRLHNGRIVELWDAVEPVAPHSVAHNDQA